MRTRGHLYDVLDKAEHGPLIIDEKEFDREFIQKPIRHLLKKYDIRWERNLLQAMMN
jgi:hypothetical protein